MAPYSVSNIYHLLNAYPEGTIVPNWGCDSEYCIYQNLIAQSCLTLQSHGLQRAVLPCPSLSPGACSNSCPLSWWCHPTLSSCHPFLLLSLIFPSIRVFPMNWLFALGGQSIEASALASVLPVHIQSWFL